MKRFFISLLVVLGAGGLVSLMRFHPKATVVGATGSSQSTAGTSGGPSSSKGSGSYKDGTYTGSTIDVGYGPVQVQAVVAGGKLTTVKFLQMPFHADTSAQIASEAKPILLQEALQVQNANVDTVSGATADSEGFTESLQSALDQAKS